MVESLTPSTARSPTAKTPWSTVLFLGLLAVAILLALHPGENVFGPRAMSNRGLAETQMANFEAAIDNFRHHQRKLPETLEALTVAAHPDGEAWLRAIPRDPWDRPFEYRVEGYRFTLRSLGEDGRPDTDDDIRWPRP